jgi:hypothetical protein
MVDDRNVPLMKIQNGGGGGGDSMEINLQFQKQNWNGGQSAGDPVKLVWEVPVETREVVVPFEFVDLPLP